MIHNPLPFALRRPNNPALNHELRKMRWPYRGQQLSRYAVAVFVIIGFLFLGAWAAGMIDNYVRYCTSAAYSTYQYSGPCQYRGGRGESGSILVFTFLLGIGGSFIIDLFYVVLPIHGIQRDIQSGHWELLKLTNIRGEDLITAKYEVNQIRAWRGLVFELALHTVGTIMLIFTYVFYSLSFSTYDSASTFFLIVLAILLTVYMIEPLWRMRALVALGMFMAMRVKNFTFATLGVLAAVFAMRIVQVIIIAAFIYFSVQMLEGFRDATSSECMTFFVLLAFLAVVYFFYRWMRDILFSRIFRLVNQGER